MQSLTFWQMQETNTIKRRFYDWKTVYLGNPPTPLFNLIREFYAVCRYLQKTLKEMYLIREAGRSKRARGLRGISLFLFHCWSFPLQRGEDLSWFSVPLKTFYSFFPLDITDLSYATDVFRASLSIKLHPSICKTLAFSSAETGNLVNN